MLAGVGDIKGGVVHWRATRYLGRPDIQGVHETARQTYESRGHNRHDGLWDLATPNACQLQSLLQQYGTPLVTSQMPTHVHSAFISSSNANIAFVSMPQVCSLVVAVSLFDKLEKCIFGWTAHMLHAVRCSQICIVCCKRMCWYSVGA